MCFLPESTISTPCNDAPDAPMSLHRVLPLPLALSDRGLAQQQWDVGADALEGGRIMTERTTSTAHLHSPRVSASLPRTSSSPAETRQSVSPQDSSEDYHSPTVTRPAPNPRKRGDIPWEQAEPFQEEEYTASICLCQPDPKVPRPRNGMYYENSRHLKPSRARLALYCHQVRCDLSVNKCCSLHPLSPAFSGFGCSTKSGTRQSSNLKGHWRPLADRT